MHTMSQTNPQFS